MTAERDDEQLFSEAMADVVPLRKGHDKAHSSSRPEQPTEAQLARRSRAQDGEEESNFLSDDFVELLPPNDPIEFRRDGIQTGVIERLRHGEYTIESRLHLQRRPVRECRSALFRFIRESHRQGLRNVMVVHGRGRSDDSHSNVVRSHVARWLTQFDEVQAYTSAQPHHGSIGATYVMLRKSERARQRNREMHQKRGSG
ncbi:DNA-nicking Smr family endonuclease [Kushneria sinocarnis]|uniref:DNA-nicking Smr family endonuclease n=1 Tax=Kushneria sinocarnis TaxID=595502 RepID=A0A420WYE6_9GAMM|nr:DNA endonuclease SmrA [Kushneria sinocarnis]RKR06208.1 DNA-nicking Smr family endonuclease [Kushneria sinocarnis]